MYYSIFSRSVDSFAICQNNNALPVARAESIAPWIEAMNIAASPAGGSTKRITPFVSPSVMVFASQVWRSLKWPVTSSATSAGILGNSAASNAQIQMGGFES